LKFYGVKMSYCASKMDVYAVATVISLLSAVLMMTSIIYILTYILGSFSSKSGTMSPRFVLFSLFYFFGSTVFLVMGSGWLSDLARVKIDGIPFYLKIGASALALSAILHVFCGLTTAFLYWRGK